MYHYSEFDHQFLRARAQQYRNQLNRYLAGELKDEEFRPLRLQNGWYIQRFAPMLRVAVPYGVISAPQLRALADIAQKFDKKQGHDLAHCDAGLSDLDTLPDRVAHFTTRQNVQFNWIKLQDSADVMDALARVNMHGIQTSGNCIRNITTDALAGISVDERIDPRPYAELIRQWSTLHPEFAFLPRKFKIAIIGSDEDRAALAWHDVGLRLLFNDANEVGFEVMAGGGMGRTPMIASHLAPFVPWQHILNYLQALLRVYNRFGRRDNLYKARLKILVKAQGAAFIEEINQEYHQIVHHDGAPYTLKEEDLRRISQGFSEQMQRASAQIAPSINKTIVNQATARGFLDQLPAAIIEKMQTNLSFARWLKQNVSAHKLSGYCAVNLSFKRIGFAPGDATAWQLSACAQLAEQFSLDEARITHTQNILLPWVQTKELFTLFERLKTLGLAQPHIHYLTDMISCPGGDFCALANARSLPIAKAIMQCYQDLDELQDLGDIDLHISGCINSCGHHHSGHIGILGVDKNGQEWYQITLGGSDGRHASGAAQAGKIIGPAFAAHEVLDALQAILEYYLTNRNANERFIQTVHRLGIEGFKHSANQVRHIVHPMHETLPFN